MLNFVTTRLDHTAIASGDPAALVDFYHRALGLVIHAESAPLPPTGQKAYLIGPSVDGNGIRQGMMMEIMPKNDTPRHPRNSHEPGLSHVAFAVSNFDHALAHLQATNVTFLGEIVTAIGGGRLISFADPEGNMMQIVERL